jgi:hypothetical protein
VLAQTRTPCNDNNRDVARMAGIMRHMAADGTGACTEDDLRSAGFTSVQIATHRDQAARLAQRASTRRVR